MPPVAVTVPPFIVILPPAPAEPPPPIPAEYSPPTASTYPPFIVIVPPEALQPPPMPAPEELPLPSATIYPPFITSTPHGFVPPPPIAAAPFLLTTFNEPSPSITVSAKVPISSPALLSPPERKLFLFRVILTFELPSIIKAAVPKTSEQSIFMPSSSISARADSTVMLFCVAN